MLKLNYKNKILRPAWIEVDLDAVGKNVRNIRNYLGDVKMLAVVKANGYGLGAVPTAKEIAANGVDYLGVVMLDEAYELRSAGLTTPILNMGAIYADQAEYVIDLDIEQMVYQSDVAAALSKAAGKLGVSAKIHVKINTGMSRFGFQYSTAVADIEKLLSLPNLDVVGAFTHFSMSDAVDKSFALLQIERMKTIKTELSQRGVAIPCWHMSNSGGALDLPQANFDMVRIGLMNYGYWPSFDVRTPFELTPAISLKSKIVAIRKVKRGDTVGYGRKYMAEKDERIAVLPIGYADGYSRSLSKIGHVLCKGHRLPIVGGLCMDATFFNITDIPNIDVGDAVTLMGVDGSEEISPHDIGGLIGSVSYDVISNFGRRLPRVYLKEGKVQHIVNSLVE